MRRLAGEPNQLACMKLISPFAALLAVVTGLWALDAQACRCRPLPLAEYYAKADHVFFATLSGFVLDTDAVALDFAIRRPVYKGGDTPRAWTTAPHSAACGLPLQAGRTYLVFATDDDTRPGVAHTGTCDGSRMLSSNGDIPDLEDVPGRHVPRQLEALAASPATPGAGGSADGRVIGLLVAETLPASLVIHAVAGAAAGKAVEPTELEDREIAYERPAIVVTGTAADGWYRVVRDGQPGWIHAPGGDYRPLDAVVVNRLNYLTPAWDGVLWPAPGAGLPYRTRYAFEPPGEVPARVTGASRVADSLWWRVEVLAEDPCDGGQGATIGAGYVPAWDAGGELTAWFYSRGC